jgi:predicted DNA-binding transcriptional regulator AlpA
MRQKAVSHFLGISRHTLRRIIERDPTFPKFIELSVGIRMVRKREVEAWLRRKELEARDRT